jgi:hypothetical protein
MAEFDAGADLREFIREMTTRFERMTLGFERTMAALIAELQRDRVLAERRHAENRVELRDLREESRAQTQALLRILDRLDDGGAAPAG